ncbi:MAG: dicarboxylate/amino acid:cation symporter [Methanobrevibacter sp.]|nr:dicarboxylate/amino acid:cation symporter [Methanobrevibacter sp.]MBO7159505.1 dicarboxylate/amino acid:cation symporter [Methanobrevibacter sp.]MBO7209389.1 dicarboxylate/amino acid:cation symporter [Methanobrevibacter sp.]MBO7241179.1 dicarboxylate/amino acid:cation symporter [Methanobrevibacter sp.]MBO7696994.1 dicarboxylate/amino acid:cation symporter [Methanobrevibacter sp.]
MINRLKKISLGNWILISMILGLIVGLILNFYVTNTFIKDLILIDNVFYLGGNLFIKLMKMLVVPLVFCSIIVGVTSISDIKKIGSIGGRVILIYLLTTALAVSIALLIAGAIEPGIGLNMPGIADPSNVTTNVTITNTILNMIPDNPLNSLANGDMLPVIIFGVIVGFILAKLKEETATINKLFTEGNTVMMEMTNIVMKFAPIGVFCLIAKTFATIGIDGFMPLSKYVACILLALGVQAFIVYPTLLVIFTRLNPIKFFKKFFSVMLFAFSSSSSNATIPLTLEKLSEMGVSKDVSSFTIPLGATINMDGTAIMQGVVVMFAAQAYGIDLGLSALLTVIFTAVMASIGTAGIPSVGLVTLNMVFASVGLPTDAIGIIMGIDHILDMIRSAVNVTGDAICTIIVSFKNKSVDRDMFNGEKKGENLL